MTSTSKHGDELTRQEAFKTSAQELEEFIAKVCAMKYGLYLWAFLDSAPNWEISRLIGTKIRLEDFPAAFREAKSQVSELWPEYLRLLRLNPEALKAYNLRVVWNGSWQWRLSDRGVPHVVDVLRQRPGRPREMAERDEQIWYMKEELNYKFVQIARELNLTPAVVRSAHERMKRKKVKN